MAATIVPTDAASLEEKQTYKVAGTDELGAGPALDETKRLWAGNLPFSTTEQQLTQMFEEFHLLDLTMPKRFGRPKGFAFLRFKDDVDLEAIAMKFSGYEVDGRPMRVQLATSTGPHESRLGGENAPLKPKLKKRFPKKGGMPSKRTGASDDEDNEDDEMLGSSSDIQKGEGQGVNGANKPRVVPRRRRPLNRQDADGEVQAGTRLANGGRRMRKGPPENGVESQITLYVANIPFTYTDDQLRELFASYDPTDVHVVPRFIPPYIIKQLVKKGEPRRCRGFGFVTFADVEARTKALEMDGKEVEGRELVVKIAIDKPEISQEEKAAAADEKNESQPEKTEEGN